MTSERQVRVRATARGGVGSPVQCDRDRRRPPLLRLRLATSVLCLGTFAASTLGCAPAQEEPPRHEHEHSDHRGADGQDAGTAANCDAQFIVAMIPHHEQALQMSDLALDRSTDRRITELAAAIIRKQRVEIEIMTDWSRSEGVPLASPSATDGTHQHDPTEMPGMLTQSELDEMASATGAAFDAMFLRGMIQHHRGALTMVEQMVHPRGSSTVRTLAVETAIAQRYEIVAMQRLLIELSTGHTPSQVDMARLAAAQPFDDPLPAKSSSNCGAAPGTP